MEDLIKREDAIKELAEYLMMDAQKEWAGTASEDIEDWKELAETVFEDIPSAENKGEWIISEVEFGYKYQCKDCGWNEYHAYNDVKPYNFCPNCGCRMKGADDE